MGFSEQNSSPKSAKTRGRPRKFAVSDTVDKALDLFWTKGIADSTTRELESFLGLSQSSLYHQFGSKQLLLEAALDRYEELTSQALLVPLSENPDGFLAIKEFFTHLSDWVTKDKRRGCMLINLMAEDGSRSQLVKARTFKYRSNVKSGLMHALDRALIKEGKLQSDTEAKADLLLTLVLGFNIAVRGGADKSELDNMLKAVSSLLDNWELANNSSV